MEKEFKKPADMVHDMRFYYLFGWKDSKGEYHTEAVDKEIYQTMSLEEIIENRIGTTIEQAQYLKYYLDKMHITSKMFCVIKDEEILYCFTLYEEKGQIYHLEHVDWKRKGVYEYTSYKMAIESILKNIKEENAKVMEIPFLPEGVSYQGLVNYITSLENTKKVLFLKR